MLHKLPSYSALNFLFPIAFNSSSSSLVQESSDKDRTLDTCTPRERWIPLQAIQINIPRLIHTQSGSFAPQSAQKLLFCLSTVVAFSLISLYSLNSFSFIFFSSVVMLLLLFIKEFSEAF